MTTNQQLREQAFGHNNIQLFAWFRVLFNCRFYYPVLAIFFIDLGLSMSQYVMLNAIWAITIVLLEVPSGALADIIGRKRLVVGSAAIMVAEMALLLFAPLDGGWLLFSVCVVNRVLAGVAEAAASGADEALAYDSLNGEKKEQQWDEVLAVLGKRRSICMAIATITGAILYDQNMVNGALQWLGFSSLSNGLIIRIPVFLCFLQGIVALLIASKMRDIEVEQEQEMGIKQICRNTWRASLWVWSSSSALVLILGGVLVDSMARNFATLTSSYYRFIGLPEYSFGFIGATIAICGFIVPYYAKPLARNLGIIGNIMIAGLITLVGLFGIGLAHGPAGIAPAIITFLSLGHIGFILSRFLNQLAPQKLRATILSVKGLLFNLGYALFSIAFAQTLTARKNYHQLSEIDTTKASNDAFGELLIWSPLLLSLLLLIYYIWSKLKISSH